MIRNSHGNRSVKPPLKAEPPLPQISKLAISQDHIDQPISKDQLWVWYQNSRLQRQLDHLHESMELRCEIWTEMQSLLQDLSQPSSGLGDDLARNVRNMRVKMKRNMELRIGMENGSGNDRMDRWTARLPPTLLHSEASTSQTDDRVRKLEAKVVEMKRELAAHDKRRETVTISALAVRDNVRAMVSDYRALKTDFSADNCLSYLDGFEKRSRELSAATDVLAKDISVRK